MGHRNQRAEQELLEVAFEHLGALIDGFEDRLELFLDARMAEADLNFGEFLFEVVVDHGRLQKALYREPVLRGLFGYVAQRYPASGQICLLLGDVDAVAFEQPGVHLDLVIDWRSDLSRGELESVGRRIYTATLQLIPRALGVEPSWLMVTESWNHAGTA